MDKLLRKYARLIDEIGKDEFISYEYAQFPKRVESIEDKVKFEYQRILRFYHDKLVNEAYYSMNDDAVIHETLQIIEDLIKQERYYIVPYYIVSLQLVMGMSVKLYTTIYIMIQERMNINEYVDRTEFLNQDLNKEREK